MTNSIGFPNQQQYPQNYSGVTIHVNNPALNTMANGYITNPAQQCNYPIAPSIGQPTMQPMTNYVPQNQSVQPQYMTSAYGPIQAQPVPQQIQQPLMPQGYPPQYYLNNYNYVQNPMAGQPAPIQQPMNNMQPVMPQGMETQANPYTQQTPLVAENDMQISQNIIKDIDARMAAQKELEKNGTQKRVVNLTNEYIMSLENYLNNPNEEIRIMASKEILTRLNEDKNRYDDPALNALLNKMLQDPNSLVRVAAMSALSSQLASGNEYTVKLLQDIQNNPKSSKEDVVEAANILLKMSADTEIKYVPKKEKASKSQNKDEAQQKQIEQLQKQLQAQRQKEIEAQLAKQMQG